jgi:hypothetical protein
MKGNQKPDLWIEEQKPTMNYLTGLIKKSPNSLALSAPHLKKQAAGPQSDKQTGRYLNSSGSRSSRADLSKISRVCGNIQLLR